MDIEVYFLGTSAGVPTPNRNVTSIVVRRKGELIFFDMGEGTQRQLFKLGLGFGKTIKVFFTHIHGDHIMGFFPLIQTLTLFKRTEKLLVFGPPKMRPMIEYFLSFLEIEPNFDMEFIEVYDGAKFEFNEYYIEAIKNSHTSWSFSYRFQEYGRPGKFNVKKALEDGIPKHLWRDLADGKDVYLNGRLIKSVDYIIPLNIKGRSIVISGDTSPFKRMILFSRDCDVLIHEATFLHEMKARSLETLHTTALEAAEIAKEANVKILVLTHFSARYEDPKPLLEEARRIFPSTFLAEDLNGLIIPYVKPIYYSDL